MSVLDDQVKTGTMIRVMSGDIRDSFKRRVYKMYGLDPSEDVEDLQEENPIAFWCAEWHWDLLVYCPTPKIAMKYISIIQYAYRNDINLNEDKDWLQLMRVVLPVQFIQKTKYFQQVSQLAMMDETRLYHKDQQPKITPMFSDIKW